MLKQEKCCQIISLFAFSKIRSKKMIKKVSSHTDRQAYYKFCQRSNDFFLGTTEQITGNTKKCRVALSVYLHFLQSEFLSDILCCILYWY